MSIRKAVKEDASSLNKLVSSLSHYYLHEKNSELPEWFLKSLSVSEFEYRLLSKDYNNYVYVVDKQKVGYISIKEQSHLYHLFVAESHQGQGIARRLWEHATLNNNVNAYTVRSSTYAIPVYKSFGFKETGALAHKDGIAFQAMSLER